MINYCAGLPTKACGCSSALALTHSNPHFSREYYSQIVSFRIILYLSVQYGLTTTHSHERKLCKPTSAPVHLPALTTPDRTDFQYWFFFFPFSNESLCETLLHWRKWEFCQDFILSAFWDSPWKCAMSHDILSRVLGRVYPAERHLL